MIQEKVIIGEGTEYPLNGLLTLPEDAHAPATAKPVPAVSAEAAPVPATAKPVPAVVFVHGSGSSNMDEKVGKLTPFKDLAEGLARHGIASIRYDKRSFAHGVKMLKGASKNEHAVITVKEETIEDAILATNLLKNDPRINAESVFVVGHSMGGMLAPRIDAEGGNFRGLVIMAGTPRKLEEIMIEQSEEALAGMNALVRFLAGGRIRKLVKSFDGLYGLTDEEAKSKQMGGGTTLYYFKEMGEHPAPAYLTNCEKPLLIMQGERDLQVKANKDFAAYQELLKDRPHATFKLYEGLNHAFVSAISNSIAQANKEFSVERHIGEDVIADIASWIKSVL